MAVTVSVFEEKTGVDDDAQAAGYGRGGDCVFGETVYCEEGTAGESEYGGVDTNTNSR